LAHKGIDFGELAREGHDVINLIGKTDYIDFKALGYAGDPIEVGGRFKKLPFQTHIEEDLEEDKSSSMSKQTQDTGVELPISGQ
jgi:hypothetical protein